MAHLPRLASARSKFERAELHRNTLNHNLGEIVAQKANRVPVYAEIDSQSGHHIFRIQSVVETEPILTALGLIIGDAVHNLRGALDHLFWQLACFRYGGPPPKPTRVQFPIEGRPGRFPTLKVRADVIPDHWDIIETHQPYHGRAHHPENSWHGAYVHPLAMLHNLSNHDKHRITTPVLEVPNQIEFRPIPGVRFETFTHQFYGHDLETTVSMVNASDVVEVGAPVARAVLSGPGAKPKIDDAGEVAPGITLAEGRPIIETIDRLTSRVDLILSEFEALFPT